MTQIRITYFQPDALKSVGSYIEIRGRIKKIDEIERLIILSVRSIIPFENVMKIEGDIFN